MAVDFSASPGDAAERRVAPDPLLHRQRRQLTVLFSDLVGSTGLSAELDPEELDEVMSAYQRRAAAYVEAAGGFVARFMGDAILAYFGFPHAREDDAARAVRVGLEIARDVPTMPTPTGRPLAVRVGVATGVVVLGEVIGVGVAREHPIAGATPNLAARLQQTALPNEVLISRLTAKVAGFAFEMEPAGVEIRDFPAEAAWRVLSERPVEASAGSRHGPAPAAFVGRETELATLERLWEEARTESGRTMKIVGPPGIGKSRVVLEFRTRLAGRPHLWLQGASAERLSNTPLQPFAQIIRRLVGGAIDPASFLKLERLLRLSGLDDPLAATLIADMAAIPVLPGRPRPVRVAADQRTRLIGLLAKALRRCAERWPTVLVVEDLHWADPSTLDLLEAVIEAGLPSRLLLICTSRNLTEPHWAADAASTLILDGLDVAEARTLVADVVGGRLSSAAVDTLVARSGGVPLFAIELGRFVEAATGQDTEREIPGTLSDLLLARLDRLGEAKSAAQAAAVFGGEFLAGMVMRLADSSVEMIEARLGELVAEGVLARTADGDDPAYVFTHALLEDAAYGALLKRHRRELHRRAATILSTHYPDLSMTHPEVVARHWGRAEEHALALEAWRQAARVAWGRRAHREAQSAYEAALAALRGLPEDAPLRERELELQSALADALQITCGYSAPQTIDATSLAKALAERGGDVEARFTHAAGLWMATSSAGDYEKAGALAEQLLALCRADGREVALGGAHMMAMTSRYRIGDLGGAEEAYLQGRQHFSSPEFLLRPGAAAQTYGNAAVIAWLQGDAAEAARRSELGLRLSRDTRSAYEIVFAQFMAGALAMLSGDAVSALALADQALAASDELGFPQYSATTRIVVGRAKAALGAPAEGAAQIAEGLERMRANGSAAWLTVYLTWLSEAQATAGDLASARATIGEALVVNSQEAFFRPHMLRVRGDLKLASGERDEAVADYLEAVRLSRLSAAVQLERAAAEALRQAGGQDRAP